MPCKATTQDGNPCQAPVVAGSEFCFHHAPEKARERGEARRRGGLAVHGLDPEAPDPEVRIRVVADVLTLLETAGADCLRQKPSLARARALAYVAATAARILEVSELEDRIRALEERAWGEPPQLRRIP